MNKILLCDESVESLKILSFIIEQKELGDVIEELESGEVALNEILATNPDLVIVDYSLKDLDGNEVIRRARKNGFEGKFLMTSKLSDPEVVAKAYENGASFFIHKPFNLRELIAVIRQVISLYDLEKSYRKIRELVLNNELFTTKETISSEITIERAVDRVIKSLGLNGIGGANELKSLVVLSFEFDDDRNLDYQISELFLILSKRTGVKQKTIEQRIRRLAQRVLNDIANKGIADYDSLAFERYSSLLFDFEEVRRQMNFLEGKGKDRGMIQLRKFIEGIKSVVLEEI